MCNMAYSPDYYTSLACKDRTKEAEHKHDF